MIHDTLGRVRRSIRVRGFDYTTPGPYFVTICTKGRLCMLDRDPIPAIVHRAWRLTVNSGRSVPEWAFVVMPNHVHGIVWLPADPRTSLRYAVRSFKSFCTRSINNLLGTSGPSVWQRGYYERIVRNERELTRFRQYILDNPAKWSEDPNHPSNLRDDDWTLGHGPSSTPAAAGRSPIEGATRTDFSRTMRLETRRE